jgi:hypothetical protein
MAIVPLRKKCWLEQQAELKRLSKVAFPELFFGLGHERRSFWEFEGAVGSSQTHKNFFRG